MARPLAFFLLLAGGVAADLWTKSEAFARVPEFTSHVVSEELFEIEPTRNPGAMWSLFQDVPSWLWVIIRGSISIGLFVYYWRTRSMLPMWVHLAFAGVLAGALGNLHDNAFAEGGKVRDFIVVWIGSYKWPTFNVADSLICVGAFLLLIHFIRLEEPNGTTEKTSQGSGDSDRDVGGAEA